MQLPCTAADPRLCLASAPNRFNYCPSDPAKQGATILALPKHKVYKGAPNFVYAVFSADQILAALYPAADREALNLSPGSFRQCQPAPPQSSKDAAGAAAYFVCDVSLHGQEPVDKDAAHATVQTACAQSECLAV
eukprot:GHRQ01023730.1.p1 GENE.GHRQ01023730.1~~GHRQ01023730.1.p1  ORF type:complete len:135 (+),score=25.27 GHRQ01023730.1:196-600(+)